MDERNKQIALKVIAVLYLITILALLAIILYRQLSLGQDISEFEDFTIVMTVNSVFLISALLYFGAVQIRGLSIKMILLIYVAFLILGSAFTYAKYNLFLDKKLSAGELFDKFLIIAAIIGLLMGFWILLSFLAKRRMDKELE